MPDKSAISPRVSLSLPVRNGERYVSQAIRSILDQTYTDFELIITDNASTDATEEICRDYARRDSRIRYVRSPQDQGAAANFNLGFNLSTGEYFKWCAHDDLISPDYLAACVAVLDAEPAVVLAYGNLTGIDENGAATGYVERRFPDLDGLSASVRFRHLLRRVVVVAAIFGVYRRSALERTCLHKPYFGSDCALLAEIVLLGHLAHVPNAVLLNREHPNRSVQLDSTERLIWQDPKASGRNPLELSRRVWHLMEIVYRRRDAEPLYRTAPVLLAWACSPLVLGRLALEAVGSVSPTLRWRLRDLGLRTLAALETPTAGSAPASSPFVAGAGTASRNAVLEHLMPGQGDPGRAASADTSGRAKDN